MNESVIDMHCHTAGIGAGNSGCFLSPALRRSVKYRFFLAAFDVVQKELEYHGDGLLMERLSQRLEESRHVQKAVVLAMDGIVDDRGQLDPRRTEMYIPNEFVAQECRKHDNLLFGASINPYRADALERLEQAVEAGAVLVKWLPSIQLIDMGDRRIEPFYRRLQELNLPLLTHTSTEESFTWSKDELGDPHRLRLPLELGVTVIAAHVASNGRNEGERNFDRILPLFTEFPNLYADISSLTQANRLGHLRMVLHHEHLHDRLLYGTDMPIIASVVTSPWFHAFRIPFKDVGRIAAMTNPWDRDVELKLALGMPHKILSKAAHVLRHNKV